MNKLVVDFKKSRRKLLIFGYNSTLMESGGVQQSATWRQSNPYDPTSGILHSTLESLMKLSHDPMNIVLIFSGSTRKKMNEMFGAKQFWLLAENGVYLRPPWLPSTPSPKWIQILDNIPLDWMESVKVVFSYFKDRTPRSSVEVRETSVVWSYRYADYEFGRVQARDLLQHLWTGPISNASVDIVQGGKSVEARPVGVTKGAMLQKALCKMENHIGPGIVPFDFVLCVGHFLSRDENIFSYLEGKDISGQGSYPDQKEMEAHNKLSWTRSETSLGQSELLLKGKERHQVDVRECLIEIPPLNLCTCTVGRSSSKAQFSLMDSFEVGEMIQQLAGKDTTESQIWQLGG
eukprot:TRINITY_DN14040_c1_g2_i5.p2 TRINITY_DN14040_c1_g2~~TRINITY_DN14040_c1_g2_i5.p2  ORF type:complete len:347 (-),score=36.74 TRINITY_DN14040_c1_g2_i5:469-1509(-)